MDPISFQPSSPVLHRRIDPIRQDLAMSSSIVTKFIKISTDYLLKQQVEKHSFEVKFCLKSLHSHLKFFIESFFFALEIPFCQLKIKRRRTSEIL